MLTGVRSAGFNLIELMITLAVIGIVAMVGLPNLSAWIQNTQIKTAAEGIQSGLQLARAEALRRNVNVRFSLVTSLSSACALSASASNWVVSLADPSGACDVAPSDTAAPRIIQKKDSSEGARNAAVAATPAGDVTFNGLGRMLGAGANQVDITSTVGGLCQAAGGPMRCLRITVSTGGQVRMCDPAVTDNTDPRFC